MAVMIGFFLTVNALLAFEDRGSTPQSGGITDGVQTETARLKQEGLEAAREVSQAYPQEPLALALLGSAHYNVGQSREAIQELKRCLEMKAEQVEPNEILARIAYEKGELEESVRFARAALKHGPATAELLNRLGRAELDLGRPQEAAQTLQQATGLPRPGSESHYLLGQAYLQSGDYLRAQQSFRQAIELMADHTQAYFGLFTATLRLGQVEQAEKYREQFKKLEVSDRRALADRADSGEGSSGLPLVRRTVARTLYGAAQLHRAGRATERAMALLRRAALLDPDNPTYRGALEALFLQPSSFPQGLKAFQAMVEQQPESPWNHLFLGRFQARLEDFESAEKSYLKVQELAPERAEGFRVLADLYYRQGRKLAEAETLARRAVELDPSGTQYHLLALICLKKQDRAGALQAVRQAVARSPGEQKYQQLLKSLEAAPSPRNQP